MLKSRKRVAFTGLVLAVVMGVAFAYFTGSQQGVVATSAQFTIDTREPFDVTQSLSISQSENSVWFVIDTRDSSSITNSNSVVSASVSAHFTIDTRALDLSTPVISGTQSASSVYFTIDTRSADPPIAESAYFTIDTRDATTIAYPLSLKAVAASVYFTIDTREPPPDDNDNDGLQDLWETLSLGGIWVDDGSGDTDGDGVSNFAEFAFGTDPNVPTPAPMLGLELRQVGDGVRYTIRHPQHILAQSLVAYRYETSTDLVTWTDITPSLVEVSPPDNRNGYVEWLTLGFDQPSRAGVIFFRVSIQRR